MYRLHGNIIGGRGRAFVRGLGPAAWFPFGVGITSAGGLVSQWDDISGNGRHLKQATGTNQPALQADGSILFDGVDNFLKCDTFTLAQPETVYLLFKQVTWGNADRIFDGHTSNSGAIIQRTTSPNIAIRATNTDIAENTNLPLDTYAAVVAVLNGASSVLQVNNTAPTTGDIGAGSMSGFCLGAIGAGTSAWANIQCKEAIIYAAAHAADVRARVIRYLARVGGLNV